MLCVLKDTNFVEDMFLQVVLSELKNYVKISLWCYWMYLKQFAYWNILYPDFHLKQKTGSIHFELILCKTWSFRLSCLSSCGHVPFVRALFNIWPTDIHPLPTTYILSRKPEKPMMSSTFIYSLIDQFRDNCYSNSDGKTIQSIATCYFFVISLI